MKNSNWWENVKLSDLARVLDGDCIPAYVLGKGKARKFHTSEREQVKDYMNKKATTLLNNYLWLIGASDPSKATGGAFPLVHGASEGP